MYAALPEERRARYEADAKAANDRRRNNRDNDDKPEYERGFQPDVLGMSSELWPIDTGVLAAIVRAELGKPAGSPLPGVSAFWRSFREKVSHRWFVRDEGQEFES